ASASFRGLVRLREAGDVALAPAPALAGRVVIDGAEVYASDGAFASLRPQTLVAGWHVVELTLPAGAAPELAWLDSNGSVTAYAAVGDFFAAETRRGWLHQTTARIGTGAELTWQGVVAYPAFGAIVVQAPAWLLPLSNDEAATPAAATPRRESWRTTWRVDAGGAYRLRLKIGPGAATLTLDGVPVLRVEQSAVTAETEIDVTAGDHALELDVDESLGGAFGAQLEIEGPSGGGEFLLP
ncbi:MAG TPA: hypothetical protein VI759_08870, partial [Dehalococcoidia bacterium]|nr:hypothetical protein [Dehalococcoidia bacterium]